MTTIVMAMEVITDDDWMMAVSNAPMTTSSRGLLMEANTVFTSGSAANSSIADDIMLKPTNSMPNPVRMPPVCFHLSFLAKSDMKAPMPAKAAKMMVVEMLLRPNIPRATNCAVTVVPMLEP